MKFITLETPITVKELSAKFKKQEIHLEIIPWDMNLTKGKLSYPFSMLPKELKNVYGRKFTIEMNKLLVKQYAISDETTAQSFNLRLEYKGSIKTQNLYVWI